MTVPVYVATDHEGNVHLIRYDSRGQNPEQFGAWAIEYLQDTCDLGSVQQLDIYRFPDPGEMASWLLDQPFVTPYQPVGRVGYVFPGEYRYLPAEEPDPTPSEEWMAGVERGIRARQEYDDAYAPDDPKHPGFHSVHADLWDSREGK